MNIRYLNHKEIDKSKWDESIKSSVNGNLYAHSWYLDLVCPNWSALISEDDHYLMPVTKRSKFGIKYLFRPLLSQQLGVFSKNLITPEDLNSFINEIPSRYKLVQYCFNKRNTIDDKWNPRQHHSYELSLKTSYNDLKSSYSENHRRNLKKALQNGFQVVDIDIDEYMKVLSEDTSPGSRILSDKTNRKIFEELIITMMEKRAGRILGIRNNSEKVISAVLFGCSHNTWYYLAPAGSDEGKKSRSNFQIIDFLIQSRAGENETLDFEGSDIPNLAKFYSGFGATPIRYDELYINSLPWPIKLLK